VAYSKASVIKNKKAQAQQCVRPYDSRIDFSC